MNKGYFAATILILVLIFTMTACSFGDNSDSECAHVYYKRSGSGMDEEWYCSKCDQKVGPTIGIDYAISSDNSYAEVIGYFNESKDVLIASVYNGVPVKSISDHAFYGCTSLESITIPEGVTSIGEYAFFGCTSLASINLPESIESIGTYAFYDCTSLTGINIPEGVTSIGGSAFSGCTSLASINCPESIESIGSYAFEGCNIDSLLSEYECGKYFGPQSNPYAVLIGLTNRNMNTYTIHEDAKIIAGGAFSGCQNLSKVNFGYGKISIGDHAFANCNNLVSISIDNGVKSIGNYAFLNCTSLTYVKFGQGVESIGSWVFYDCNKLDCVYLDRDLKSIGDNAFTCANIRNMKIIYSGTKAEWEKIENSNKYSYLITCTDGKY